MKVYGSLFKVEDQKEFFFFRYLGANAWKSFVSRAIIISEAYVGFFSSFTLP